MAKVFVGSTGYDLRTVRAEIVECLRNMGHAPIYFESPSFHVPQGLHSHDACIQAVEQCEVYLLIINKRYGGKYVGTLYPEMAGKSITHAETLRALELKKRVFPFVCQSTWDERSIYKKNPDTKTVYVENPRIFDLVDEVLHRQTDNWIWFFENSVELQ
jgi:hypothetical protein